MVAVKLFFLTLPNHPVVRVSKCFADVFLVQVVQGCQPALCEDGTGGIASPKTIGEPCSESIICVALGFPLRELLNKHDLFLIPFFVVYCVSIRYYLFSLIFALVNAGPFDL